MNIKKRILVIEDDVALSKQMQEKLDEEGFDVQIALDGEQAEHMIGSTPDLILLDIMLPKKDGLALLKQVREQGEWGSRVPVILITNLNPDTDDILKATMAYNPAFYLVKAELSLTEIVNRVRSVLP